jgi:hypothetical protein
MKCPKCGGRVCYEYDIHGHYVYCMNCGWARDLDLSGNYLIPTTKFSKGGHTPDTGKDIYSWKENKSRSKRNGTAKASSR